LDWLTNSPEELDAYLVHEMAHVAQNYAWWRTPPHWTEGLADYATYKLGYTNAWRCAQCSAMYPHYTSGYSCAAAFLFFVEADYNAQIAAQLNQKLRRGKYSDAFFKDATGIELRELWKAFQKTPAFTSSAADILKMEESLGYVNGKPTAKTKSGAAQKIAQARSYAIIEQQPGGAVIVSAYQFLKSLRDNDQLPLAAEQVSPGAAGLDLVYRRGGTAWVRALSKGGRRISDGRTMLVAQGAAAFERFFPGVHAPVEVMRAAVERALRA